MAAEEGRGHLFIIDARVWAKVTSIGMSAAVAYLVLACGTGRDNKATPWSIKAVKKYAGMGWERAKPAIDELIAGGFIRLGESHTASKPRYELATYCELVDFETVKNPPAQPNCYEREVLKDLQAGRQPRKKTFRRFAECLCDRGLLCRDAQGFYILPEPVTEASGDHPVWLPKSIVMGTPSGEQSPVLRLRAAGCLWTLRLFVDLYSAQNLRDDGGISPRIIQQKFDRQKIGQQGVYILWGFKSTESTHWWTGPFAAHRSRTKTETEDESPAWQSLGLLRSMGLLSFVPHIFENDTDAAEAVHPFGIGEIAEDPLERKIGNSADSAARAMALPSKLEEAEDAGFEYFCPVSKTMPTAQMVGVARLTYRPHTTRTSAWSADLHQKGPGWIENFNNLAAKAEKASLQRAANYA